MEWVTVPLADLDSDGRAVVDANGREIAVFVVGGDVHAFENACPHEGNPLVEGDVLGETLTCAYHGWRFDLATGSCLVGEEPALRFPAELRDGEIFVRVD